MTDPDAVEYVRPSMEELAMGMTRPAKAARAPRESDYVKAKRAISEWGRPLACAVGEVWSPDTDGSWRVVTDAVLDHCNRICGRNSKSGVFEIVQSIVSVPEEGHCYHVLRDGKWAALGLGDHEVLFADYRVDLRDGSTTPCREPVFGPRIGLNYATDDADEPRCHEFEALVEHAIPDPEIRRHLQEVCGSILQPHVPLRGQIVFWGVPHSGKSTLATAIAVAAAGMSGCSFVQEDRLVRDKWAPTALYRRLVNVSNDSPINKRWGSWLKEYSSGTYTCEAKYAKPRSVVATAKLIATCNQMQSLADASGAAGARILAWRFDRALPRTRATDQDKWLSPLFWLEPGRRAGVVSWLMEGLSRVHARGQYDPPVEWEMGQARAREEADPMLWALSDGLELNPGGWVSTTDVLALLSESDHAGRSPMVLADYLRRVFPGVKRERRAVSGVRAWGWSGLCLKGTDQT